jgi:hypothetical protein
MTPYQAPGAAASAGPALSLDDLFRRTAARKPDADALVDPDDKMRVTGQPPRRLTYAQADRAITKLAAHFIEGGLPTGSIVALQLPNTVEMVLTMLAAMRAGLSVALLPQLWRQAELNDAINRIGARAFVTTARIDGIDHADIAMHAAAEAFSIRQVFAFGDGLPEGMLPLDDVVFGANRAPHVPERSAQRANLITFDVLMDGLRAVPRTQMQVIAGGLAVFLETNVPSGVRMMSAAMPSSFAGLSASTVTWLLTGGTLCLHHPFEVDVLLNQIATQRCALLVAPAPLALRLGETGAFADLPLLTQVIGLWRTPEQTANSSTWTYARSFSDLYAFGEAGLFAIPRDAEGAPAPIFTGPRPLPGHAATQGSANQGSTGTACDLFITKFGTLGLRGAMVPIAAYAQQNRSSDMLVSRTATDHVDTGYAARLERRNAAIRITAPPSGLLNVGGYRFLASDLNDWALRLPQGGMLTALPDRISGHRLAGRASDNARARAALSQLGLNPLMVEAFRDRSLP